MTQAEEHEAHLKRRRAYNLKYKQRRLANDPNNYRLSGKDGLSYRTEKTEEFINQAVLETSGECLLWPYAKNGDGYGHVKRNGRRHIVSKIVCERAHGPPPTSEHETAHNCGNASCVNQKHVRWATHSENLADKIAHGTHNRGERHNCARLTQCQVLEILSQRSSISQVNLARMYGVSQGAIQNIMDRKTWGWLNV